MPKHSPHDVDLPEWGPYTKKYAGISHIADAGKGLRFDLSVFPGFYRRRVDVPSVMWECGHHPWEAAADLSWYAYRFEMEWKDRVYCDVGFARVSDSARLVRAEFVNETDVPQNVVLHYMASMTFPPVAPYRDEPIHMVKPVLGGGVVWVDALDYAALRYAVARPQDNLVYENWLRGEVRDHGFSGGTGIGGEFGRDAGDQVEYRVELPAALGDGALLIRYRLKSGQAEFESVAGRVVLASTGDADEHGFRTVLLPLGTCSAGENTVRLISCGTAAVELDGFALGERDAVTATRFESTHWSHAPHAAVGPVPNSMILKYADVENYYGVLWQMDAAEVRRVHAHELDRFFRQKVHEHVAQDLRGPGDGHFTNIFQRPITLAPRSRARLNGVVCVGTRAEVERQLREANLDTHRCELLCAEARSGCVDFGDTSDALGQRLLAATTLTNVVYPVYTKRAFIRHNTPGRVWDCLYTWDSGFIGLGLLELDVGRAIDCLNAYLTEPEDEHAAFVHHGTPLPVQSWLFQEIYNRTQSAELIAHVYPRLLRYYRFLAGKLGSSNTRRLSSGLLNTFSYFYNSGGWDDYPPQKATHAEKLADRMAPCVSTSHVLRMARTLRSAADIVGASSDVAELDQDIGDFFAALQSTWDEEAGYFSYLLHDSSGSTAPFFRHESGANYNMGLDGTSPLVADACTSAQREWLLSHLFDPRRLWTPIGLSTVDQSAPYYKPDGYWNGAVWMPHQWFIWKALLDMNQPDEAFRVARTALDVWQKETQETYNCFEHFLVQSGRGAGWHHFGGLSTPVLAWFAAYYRPGRITVGANVWITTLEASSEGLYAKGLNTGTHAGAAIVTLDAGQSFSATLNGDPVPVRSRLPGNFEFSIPPGRFEVGFQKGIHAK